MSGRNAYPHKVGSSGFDVEVQEIENDPIREIAEAAVVHDKPLAGIDHLLVGQYFDIVGQPLVTNFDVVQVLFFHGLELRNARRDAGQIMLDCILRAPSDVLSTE